MPESTYWLFDGDRPVGYGKIRHFLTDKLLEDGGSIGYAVRPPNGKGIRNGLYASAARAMRPLGIPKVLLTIHKDNLPSRKVALANGGVVERTTDKICYIWIAC